MVSPPQNLNDIIKILKITPSPSPLLKISESIIMKVHFISEVVHSEVGNIFCNAQVSLYVNWRLQVSTSLLC